MQSVVREPAQKSEPTTQILQVKSISRAFINFIPAVALIYRRTTGSEVQVGFAIDGRLSHAHESAFAACEGPARMGITTALLDSTVAPAAAAKKAFAPSKAQRARAIQKPRAQIAEKACADAPNSGPDNRRVRKEGVNT